MEKLLGSGGYWGDRMAEPRFETRGIARCMFIFSNLPQRLKEALPEAMYEFGDELLRSARRKAFTFSRTGELAASIEMEIKYEQDRVQVIVGPTAPHGPFVSFGTRQHPVNARIEVAPGTWRWIGLHPGHGGNPYLEWALVEVAPLLPKFLQPFVIAKVLELDRESLPLQFEE